MSQFWKTKEFSKLNKKWAKKLADNGFTDIEKEINGECTLIQFSDNAYRSKNRIYIESKIEFYELVSRAVHEDLQMPKNDRYIMTRYGEGIKQCQILKELKIRGVTCHRITIIRTISAYLHKWRIPMIKPRKTIKKL